MELAELEVDLSDLEKACDYFDQQVKQLVDEDPKLTEMITRLQEVYQQSGRLPPLPEREKEEKEEKEEEKVIYIQAFLKRQEDEEKKEK
jgi:septal ring factor EnvC (AmiA/AmiB activator)